MVEVLPGRAGALTTRDRIARLFAHPPAQAVLAVAATILAVRRAGAWTNPQFWAEDNLFYERAYSGGWHALFEPMSGYLHLVLRFIAWAAACADPAFAPWIFVAGAAVATLYVVSRALASRCPLPRYAGACALAVMLVPDAREVLLNVVNLQWVLGAGLILLLISRDPEDGLGWAHDLTASAAIGLTGPDLKDALNLLDPATRAQVTATPSGSTNCSSSNVEPPCLIASVRVSEIARCSRRISIVESD